MLNGPQVSENIVYGNYDGIIASTLGSRVFDNRLYNNANVAITADTGTDVSGNYIYSNSTGILATTSFSGAVSSNLLYANTNRGLLIQNSNNSGTAQFFNNTIYQTVGDGIRLDGGARNNQIDNNIIWVLAGYGLYVDNNSQTGLQSDYNLFQGDDPNAYVGFWNGANRDLLADWNAASGTDANSVEGNPGFVDIDGADNVLGYVAAGGGIDGGLDDNFYRGKNSPAIDRGNSWFAAATDIEGFGRFDDPSIANAGGVDYSVTTLPPAFAATGTATNWRSDDNYWNQAIGFNFPLYGINYTSVNVGSNGLLQFASTSPWPGDPSNSTASLNSGIRIAPLWDDLRTDKTDDDVFVDTSIGNQITIRWAATVNATGAKANFSATLFSDGRIRFDYGTGNTGLTPTVGISRGDGQFFKLVSSYDGATSLTNANSVTLSLVPGIVDIGAYEFRGDSSDNVSPTVVSTLPGAGITATHPTDVRLTFSEELNPIDARSPAAYELRGAGSDNTFDTVDDVVYKLNPQYAAGQNTVILELEDTVSPLPLGTYRLTAFGTASTSLYDLAGNRFDGDGSGTPGGNYFRTFKVIDNNGPVANGQTVTTNEDTPKSITLSGSDIEGSSLNYLVVAGPTRGTLSGTAPNLVYTPNANANGSDSFTFKVYDGALYSAVVAVTILRDITPPVSAVQPLAQNATSRQIAITASGSDPNRPVGSPVSGVKEFDLFVAVDKGLYSKFATVPVSNPTSVFTVASNHTYFFRSIARDNAGNVESKPANYADAFTRVADLDKPITQVNTETHNANGLFTLNVSGSEIGGSQLAVFNLYVSINGGTPLAIGAVSAGTATAAGVYSATAIYQAPADGQTRSYRFFSRGRDSSGNLEDVPTSGDVTVSNIAFAPPVSLRAFGIDVQGGAKQRSYITNVDLLFNDTNGLAAMLGNGRIVVERFGLAATDLTAGKGKNVPFNPPAQPNGSKIQINFGSELGIDGFYQIRADVNGDGDFADPGEMFEFHRLLGDANGDAIVDAADTAVVDRFYGHFGTGLDGDLDGNGVVNSVDQAYTNRPYRGRKLADALKQLLDD